MCIFVWHVTLLTTCECFECVEYVECEHWTGKPPRRKKPKKCRKSDFCICLVWKLKYTSLFLPSTGNKYNEWVGTAEMRMSKNQNLERTKITPIPPFATSSKKIKSNLGNQRHPGQGALADLHTASHNFRCLCVYRSGSCTYTGKLRGRRKGETRAIFPHLTYPTVGLVCSRRKIHCFKSKSARGIRITIWQNPRHSA